MRNDELISKAQSVINRKTINGRLHGDVGAALISEKGDIYAGVCVDTPGSGLCALCILLLADIAVGSCGTSTKITSKLMSSSTEIR